jgi:cysteine synthase A
MSFHSSQSFLADDVTEALGMVPIVRLNRIHPICKRRNIFIKLESCNPGGSIKEKNAAFLIKHAEAEGLLHPGGTIIESSSGNFGIGLAMVGAARGYQVMIVVDAKTAPPMRRMLTAYGAKLVDVPLSEADANGSMQVARMKKAEALSKELPGAWYPCQHFNPLNPRAHFNHTAHEIERAFGGAPDSIVIGVSTAGQLAGIATYFKSAYPQTKIIAVDVAGSVIFGTPARPYKMTGLGLSFVPPNYDSKLVDEAYSVDDQTSFSICHSLALSEGLLLGASTGAIVAAGLNFAHQQPDGHTMVMINPDRGDRYLETIYNYEWLIQQKINISSGDELLAKIRCLEPVLPILLRGK